MPPQPPDVTPPPDAHQQFYALLKQILATSTEPAEYAQLMLGPALEVIEPITQGIEREFTEYLQAQPVTPETRALENLYILLSCAVLLQVRKQLQAEAPWQRFKALLDKLNG